MSSRPHISIRSGWRCINDGQHIWSSDDKFRRNGRRCDRCQCTEAAPAIWLITANHPEHGVIQKHCKSFNEAIAAINRSDPIDALFDGLTVKLGHSLYAT